MATTQEVTCPLCESYSGEPGQVASHITAKRDPDHDGHWGPSYREQLQEAASAVEPDRGEDVEQEPADDDRGEQAVDHAEVPERGVDHGSQQAVEPTSSEEQSSRGGGRIPIEEYLRDEESGSSEVEVEAVEDASGDDGDDEGDGDGFPWEKALIGAAALWAGSKFLGRNQQDEIPGV